MHSIQIIRIRFSQNHLFQEILGHDVLDTLETSCESDQRNDIEQQHIGEVESSKSNVDKSGNPDKVHILNQGTSVICVCQITLHIPHSLIQYVIKFINYFNCIHGVLNPGGAVAITYS
jgi:hypothetical protein